MSSQHGHLHSPLRVSKAGRAESDTVVIFVSSFWKDVRRCQCSESSVCGLHCFGFAGYFVFWVFIVILMICCSFSSPHRHPLIVIRRCSSAIRERFKQVNSGSNEQQFISRPLFLLLLLLLLLCSSPENCCRGPLLLVLLL